MRSLATPRRADRTPGPSALTMVFDPPRTSALVLVMSMTPPKPRPDRSVFDRQPEPIWACRVQKPHDVNPSDRTARSRKLCDAHPGRRSPLVGDWGPRFTHEARESALSPCPSEFFSELDTTVERKGTARGWFSDPCVMALEGLQARRRFHRVRGSAARWDRARPTARCPPPATPRPTGPSP